MGATTIAEEATTIVEEATTTVEEATMIVEEATTTVEEATTTVEEAMTTAEVATMIGIASVAMIIEMMQAESTMVATELFSIDFDVNSTLPTTDCMLPGD